MTLVTADGKVSRLILGSDTWVNSEDVWQPCKVSSDFSGTPILMHYDSDTGVTTFIGAADISWSSSKGMWNKVLLTLPEGYIFTKTDETFPFGKKTSNGTSNIMFGTGSSIYSDMTFNMSGNEVYASFNWKLDANSAYPTGRMIIFMSNLDANVTGYHGWQTTTVVPD